MKILRRIILAILLFQVTVCSVPAQVNKQQVQNWNTTQPTRFIENKGQVVDQNGKPRNDIKYIYTTPGFKLILKNNSFSYEFYAVDRKEDVTKPDKLSVIDKAPESSVVNTSRVDVTFSGANAFPIIEAEEKSNDFNNYYLAHTPEAGITDVYSYGKVTYRNIYNHIDLVFCVKQKEGKPHLKYDIIVHPGGRPEDIKMLYTGADGLSVNENNISFKTQYGQLEESIPHSYIKESGKEVKAAYRNSGNCVSFSAAKEYKETLIIDPMVVWSTYYGGNSSDKGHGISTDTNGYVYMSGVTGSTNNIATSGAHLTSASLHGDFGMLVKFSSSGVRQWGTYYSSGGTFAWGICIDINNYVIITGSTYNQNGIATSGAYQTTNQGPTNHRDAFVVKFDSNGKRKWGTFYGGNTGSDFGLRLVSDADGNIYMSGTTGSSTGIATSGSYQSIHGGKYDAFLVKFDSSGFRQWATYLGGTGYEHGHNLAIDINKSIYLVGSTESSSNISTSGAHQSTYGGGTTDAFVAKFNNSGKLLWSSYYGGSGDDIAYEVTNQGTDIYLAGSTSSSSGIATSGSHLSSYPGSYMYGFISKFDSSGLIKWGTYFGATNGKIYGTRCNAICASDSNIFIVGNTEGLTGIATKGVHQDTLGGKWDAFVAKFNNAGKQQWCTYFGGTTDESGNDITISDGCNVYMTGETASDKGIATNGAHQTSRTAYYDAFIAKFPTFGVAFTGASSLCVGTSAVYKAVKETGSTYAWKVSGGKITAGKSSSDSITVLWDKSGTASVKLIVSPASGCYDSVTKTVTVHALPAAYTGLSTSICYGNKLSIGAKAVTGNSYSWRSVPAGFTSTLANPTVDPLVTTKYYLTETVVATGCTKTDSVTVTVIPLPLVEINGASAYCELGKTSYTTKAESGSTLRWTVTGGTILNGHGTDSVFVVWNKWGEGQVKLIETTINGCIDSNKVKIKINALPKADFTGTRVCFGDTTVFKNYSNNSAVFHWDFGDQNTSSQTHPRHIYSAPGIYNVSLGVTSFDGCVDTFKSLIIVDSIPTASFTTENSICFGQELVFKNNSNNGHSYYWQFGDNSNSTLQNPKHTYNDTGTFTIMLKIKSLQGCENSFKEIVRVNPMPKADFNAEDVCLGESVHFENQSIFGDNYIWSFGDSQLSYTASPVYSYKAAGTYKIQLKVKGKSGCTDSLSKTITVHPLPVAAFKVQEDSLKRSFIFTAVEKNYVQYNWSLGDGNTASDNTIKHTYKKDSTYKIRLTVLDTNGCSSQKDTTVTVMTIGLKENTDKRNNAIEVYPNPFSTHTIVEFSLQQVGKVRIILYDISGQAFNLMPSTIYMAGKHQFILDSDQYNIPKGIYLLRIETGSSAVHKKIVKIE